MNKAILTLLVLVFSSNLLHAQWQEIPGLYMESEYVGMNVKQIVAEGNMLFAIIENMVYLSYNNGGSWMRPTGYNGYANCVAARDSELFVGAAGVLFSDNLGSSYQAINQNLPEHPRVLAMQATDSVLVALVNSSDPVQVWDVFISSDKGKNWSLSHGLTDKFVECLTSDGLILYAGSQSGIYRSVDNGRNWTGIGLSDKAIYTIAAKGSMIYAAENNSNGHLYLSKDDGIHWDTVPGAGLTTTWFNSIVLKDQYIFVASLWDGVFRSANDGDTWTKTASGIKTLPVYALALCKNQVFAGTLNGIAISGNNGSSWNQSINTYNLEVSDIGLSGNNLLATTNQGINRTSDNGYSWDREYIDMQVIECEDSFAYFGGNKGFYHSSDFGESLDWFDVRGLPSDPKFTDICAADSLVWGSLYKHGIYFSDNGGVNWSERNNGLKNKNIIALTLSDSTFFAASDTGGIFRSDNLGLNWNPANIGPENQNFTCLANYRNYLFAGTSNNGIYKSSDKGSTWSKITAVSSDSKINCLFTYGNNLFAGIEGEGLHLSVNNGESWIPYNQGLMDYNINSIDGNDGSLYIGTNGGAVWARSMSDFPLSLSVREIEADKMVICEGDSVQLTARVIGGNLPYRYMWNDGQSGSIIRVHPSGTTMYILRTSDANGDTASLEITIWVKNRPDMPTLAVSGDTLISSAEEGNMWYYEDELLYGVNTDKHIPQADGHYSVRVFYDGCLSEMSEEIPYGLVSSISPNFADRITIYPNPTHDKLFVKSSVTVPEIFIQIITNNGEVVLQQEFSGRELQIDTGHLRPGNYYLKIVSNGQSAVRKFVKE